MTSFSLAARDVMTMRKNFGAPESMKLLEPVKTQDMTGKTITIDEIIVSNKVKKDENGNVIMTKDGQKEIYQPFVYVAFDNGFYFSTKSQLLIDQLKTITGQELVFYEKKEVPVNIKKGTKAKISTEKVKYRDGKMYDQVVFTDAE
jgi:hypothetical protein